MNKIILIKLLLWEMHIQKRMQEEKGEETLKVDMEFLKSKNDSTRGWIKVGGTNINYPVVQAEDNDFYLT